MRDGHGIKALIAAGIGVAVISGRRSDAVQRRCRGTGHPAHASGRCRQGRGTQPPDARSCASSRTTAPASVMMSRIVPMMQRAGLAVAVADAHAGALAVAHRRTRTARWCRRRARGVRLAAAARGQARHDRPLRACLLCWPLVALRYFYVSRVTNSSPAAAATRQAPRAGLGGTERGARFRPAMMVSRSTGCAPRIAQPAPRGPDLSDRADTGLHAGRR